MIVNIYNGIPRVCINTENCAEISSKEEYIKADLEIENCHYYGVNGKYSCDIRGRGNATWLRYPKKPYKIRLSKKESIVGLQANKDWVLLVDYTDKTSLRTAYMAELSDLIGLDYTINYRHVELILNSEYLGTYVLTDQVEKGKNRVDISNEGFIIENDTYYKEEPYYFITDQLRQNYTFKYPKVVGENDDTFFMKSYMNRVEQSIIYLSIDSTNTEWMSLIDIDSFSKWYIVAELTGNLDPNLYYVLPSRCDKLKMTPIWDAEWSLGLACKGNPNNPYGWFFWGSQHAPMRPDEEYWKNELFFKYLFKSPIFRENVKKQWRIYHGRLQEKQEYLHNLSNYLELSQNDNFERWPIWEEHPGGTLVVMGGWRLEVDYIERWLSDRIVWFDNYVLNM